MMIKYSGGLLEKQIYIRSFTTVVRAGCFVNSNRCSIDVVYDRRTHRNYRTTVCE